MERPKPFNTWELADFTEDAVQLFEARVVNLKTALAILLVLDSDFGAKPAAQVGLQPADIGVNRCFGRCFRPPTAHQHFCLTNRKLPFTNSSRGTDLIATT